MEAGLYDQFKVWAFTDDTIVMKQSRGVVFIGTVSFGPTKVNIFKDRALR